MAQSEKSKPWLHLFRVKTILWLWKAQTTFLPRNWTSSMRPSRTGSGKSFAFAINVDHIPRRNPTLMAKAKDFPEPVRHARIEMDQFLGQKVVCPSHSK